RQAVSDGADFIVGPLEKQAVETLLQSRLDVTVLALNQAEQASHENTHASPQQLPKIIQFGLSPEDEARQVAEKGIFDGHNKALVISPNDEWGFRLASAFGEAWTALGGKVLEYVSYDHRALDYSTPVKKLLNIDSSQLRANKLRQKINRDLKSEPRLRKDADMIFMAAVPLSARQIVPQFRFYLAEGIPVYSSSHSYSGIENPQADSDMNGILFTDMPALLNVKNQSSSVHAGLNSNWSADTSGQRRLYALGIDAYRMIPFLGKLALQDTAVYSGETGDLYMTKEGRIQRKLLWAKFVNGKPRLIDEEMMH
ncbi:MAG: outer membrane PBP1 activator LpoA protein, partial [Gammaproteobacteria bacterium]